MRLRLALAVCLVVTSLAATIGWSAAASPFVYVTDGLSAQVSQYDASGGALLPLEPPVVGTTHNPVGVTVSPDGRSVYVAIPEPGAILRYSIGATGALTLTSSTPVPPGVLPEVIAFTPDGRNAYVLNAGGSRELLQYSVAPDGTLSPKSPPTVPDGSGPTRIAVSPDGRSVYVTSSDAAGNPAVFQFSVEADGTLIPKSPPSVPTGDEPVGVAVTPDGTSVYVAAAVARADLPGAVFQYSVGPDGGLAPKAPASVIAGADPFELVVSPDGHSVYVTDSAFAGRVLQFTVGAGGALTPKVPAAVSAGSFPLGIAITPDGSSVYVANAGDDSVSQYSVGPGGQLAPRQPASVPAGDNPIEIAITPVRRLPVRKEDCLKGGWRSFPGFKNQGDCVSFVATGGKNSPRG